MKPINFTNVPEMSEAAWQEMIEHDYGRDAFDGLKNFWVQMADFVHADESDDAPEQDDSMYLSAPCGCEDCDARETLHFVHPYFRMMALAEIAYMLEEGASEETKAEPSFIQMKMFLSKVGHLWSSTIEPSSVEPGTDPVEPEDAGETSGSGEGSWSSSESVPAAGSPAQSPTGSGDPAGR